MNKILFCLFLIFAHFAQADLLTGRLFSSTLDRDNLDYLRKIKKPTMPVINVTTAVSQTPIERVAIELPASISVQGYVKRNDGKDSTVWINNQAVPENSRIKDLQVGSVPDNGNRIPIKLTVNGKRLSLKAGQVYQTDNGSVRETRNYGWQNYTGIIVND